MTDADEMAARGRLVTDYAEAKQRLATFEAEADRMGKQLRELSMLLTDNPDRIVFSGQPVTPEYQNVQVLDDKLPAQVAKIPALVQDIRQIKAEVQRLHQRMVALGLVDSLPYQI